MSLETSFEQIRGRFERFLVAYFGTMTGKNNRSESATFASFFQSAYATPAVRLIGAWARGRRRERHEKPLHQLRSTRHEPQAMRPALRTFIPRQALIRWNTFSVRQRIAAWAEELASGEDQIATAETLEWARHHAPTAVTAVRDRLPAASPGGGRMKEFIRDLDASPRLRAIRYQRPAEGHPQDH
jgi:hypothetical protein